MRGAETPIFLISKRYNHLRQTNLSQLLKLSEEETISKSKLSFAALLLETMEVPKTGVGGVGEDGGDSSHEEIRNEHWDASEGNLRSAESITLSEGPEGERHGISRGQNQCHEEGSGQYDFNTPTIADRLWIGPDTVTVSNSVDRPRVDKGATMEPPPVYSYKEPDGDQDTNDSRSTMVKTHPTDLRIVELQQKMDQYAATLRAVVPSSLAEAVALAGRLAEVEALRRIIDSHDENAPADNIPPSYQPAWEHALFKNSQGCVTLDTVIHLPRSAPIRPPSTCTQSDVNPSKIPYDIRVYTDPAIGRAFSEQRKEDFKRYREQRGLTTYTSRFLSWCRSIIDA